MASADGRIVIDIELEDGSVVRGLGDIGDQADRVGKKSSSVFGKLGTVLKGVGAVAVGVVGGIGALYGSVAALSIPLVRAAADAQALNSQFDQVFGKLAGAATKSLNSISAATSINSGRLKASFVQIAAFAKTTGVDAQEALNLSSRALVAAADSAAFYDKSIEDTTESLQSFLKGNFENDAALGISATETTRNAVANRLYGKSFKELDEAQKQLSLLTLVEDGNNLSGALGQAARESDGLENVLGNLKQAYEDFKISLGDTILATAIDLLKGLTTVINNIDISPLTSGLTFLVAQLRRLGAILVPVFKSLYSGFVTTLSNIRSFFESEGTNILNTARSIFGSVVAYIQGVINMIAPIVDRALKTVTSFWETNGANIISTASAIFKRIFSIVNEVLGRVIAIVQLIVSDIARIWDEYGAQITLIVGGVLAAILAVFQFVLPAIQFIVELVWGAIVDIIEGALGVISGLVKIFSGLFSGDFKKLWDGVKQLFKSAIQLIFGLISISFVGAIRTAITNFVKATVNLIKGQWTSIVNIFKSSVNGISTTISSWVNNILRFFRNLSSSVYNIAVGIWNGVKNAFSSGVTNALSYVTSLKDKVVSAFSGINLYTIGKNILQGLINGIGSLASKVTDKVNEIVEKIPLTIRKILGIASPSKVTTELGEFTGEGVEVGLDNSIKGIKKATSNVSKAAIPNNIVNRLRGSSVGVGGVSAGLLKGGTNTSNTSNINNSTNPVYNINMQTNETQELERVLRRFQFGY